MVEMRETARLLLGLDQRSLLLLDEVGRGTSTFDGLAIAWALAEHLHDNTRAKVLFATHFHELTDLARERRDRRGSTPPRQERSSRPIASRSCCRVNARACY